MQGETIEILTGGGQELDIQALKTLQNVIGRIKQ